MEYWRERRPSWKWSRGSEPHQHRRVPLLPAFLWNFFFPVAYRYKLLLSMYRWRRRRVALVLYISLLRIFMTPFQRHFFEYDFFGTFLYKEQSRPPCYAILCQDPLAVFDWRITARLGRLLFRWRGREQKKIVGLRFFLFLLLFFLFILLSSGWTAPNTHDFEKQHI